MCLSLGEKLAVMLKEVALMLLSLPVPSLLPTIVIL